MCLTGAPKDCLPAEVDVKWSALAEAVAKVETRAQRGELPKS